jgi:hypothetical protein
MLQWRVFFVRVGSPELVMATEECSQTPGENPMSTRTSTYTNESLSFYVNVGTYKKGGYMSPWSHSAHRVLLTRKIPQNTHTN